MPNGIDVSNGRIEAIMRIGSHKSDPETSARIIPLIIAAIIACAFFDVVGAHNASVADELRQIVGLTTE